MKVTKFLCMNLQLFSEGGAAGGTYTTGRRPFFDSVMDVLLLYSFFTCHIYAAVLPDMPYSRMGVSARLMAPLSSSATDTPRTSATFSSSEISG